ncbi:MAG: carbohydrate ABC transporter permease [Spirochaetes bacterium]|nr:carbohydrate ABC transporter permease [Spirochaetota bacterium]
MGSHRVKSLSFSEKSAVVTRTVGWIMFGLFFLWTVFPIYWMLSSALKVEVNMFTIPPTWLFRPSLRNFKNLQEAFGILKYLKNSLISAGLSTLIAIIFGSMAGYGLSRGKAPVKKHIAFWMITTRMAPIVGVIVPLYILFKTFHLVGTLYALIIAYTTFNLPFATWLMKAFFDDLPKEMEEAAQVDGASKFRAFFVVALPMVRPGLVVVATLCFMFAWNDYGFAVVFTSGATQTLPVATARLMTEYGIVWGQVMTLGTILLSPVLIIGILIRKNLVRGLTLGAV